MKRPRAAPFDGAEQRLAASYRRALTQSLVARLPGHERPRTLPDRGLPAEPVRIDPRKLEAFQRGIGAPIRNALPSSYLHTLAFPQAMALMARPDFPLPTVGMVHIGTVAEQWDGVQASDELAVESCAENLSVRRTGTQVDVQSTLTRRGSTVWAGTSTYLAPGVFLASPPEPEQQRPGQRWEAPLPTARWHLDRGVGRRYARVSGDWNPIHLGRLPAKLLGIKGPIAHGMYLAGRMLGHVGDPPAGPLRWGISFHTPVRLPATLEITVRPISPYAVGTATTALGWEVQGWTAGSSRPHFSGWIDGGP